MKKIAIMSSILVLSLAVALTAQDAPAGGGGRGAGRGGGQGGPGGGGPGGPGGPGGGGGGRGAGGGGGRGGGVPAAPAALQTVADNMTAAINKMDAAALTKMLAMDAVYLDEDGHSPPISAWVTNLTKPGKTFAITASHGQMLDDNAAWLSFNYTLTETFNNAPKTITGTASIALKKVGADWMISMIHGALKQSVAGMTQ